MSMSFPVTAGGSSIPTGMYKATFDKVEEMPVHKEFGRGVRFSFTVVGGEHDGEEATVICGVEKPASPKNRLGRILGGITGKAVVPGETILLDDCIGKTYLIQVEPAPSGTGTRIGVVMPNFA